MCRRHAPIDHRSGETSRAMRGRHARGVTATLPAETSCYDGGMLSFEEARDKVLSDVPSVGTERVNLRDVAGRVLAKPIVAREPFPPFAASAMDGYAVAATSFGGDGPWTLEVSGESRVGREPPALVRGTACRIFTGAPVPGGADAVRRIGGRAAP